MVAAAPLIGMALSAGSGVMQYQAASQANAAQAAAMREWMSYQRQKAAAQHSKDQANRQKANIARQDTLKTLGDAKGTVGKETQRLTEDLGAGNTMKSAPQATVNDALLAGQGSNPSMKNFAAKELFNAAQQSRQKTAALAAMQAYTGSQFGLQNTNAHALTEGQNQIDLYNNYRRGDLATYGLAKTIQPLQVAAPNSGMGAVLGQLGGAITSLGKDGLSGMF